MLHPHMWAALDTLLEVHVCILCYVFCLRDVHGLCWCLTSTNEHTLEQDSSVIHRSQLTHSSVASRHCAWSSRNRMLEDLGLKPPISLKTGTTICGIVFADGVILGADTRATEGPIVADKNCAKIHYIAPNI